MIAGGTGVQWWCSALGTRWTWHWRPYPGIWAIVALTALWVWRHLPPAPRRTTRHRVGAVLGVAALWVTLDWPLGPLGAGYLASVHAAQFMTFALVIPPLLLVSVDRESLRRGGSVTHSGGLRNVLERIGGVATHPVIAGATFTVVMSATHMPGVLDGMMGWQAGAFALDMCWFGAGLLLWWPVIVRVPDRSWFVPPLRMMYLFLATQAHLLIAMWLLGAPFPVYATYELAPRVISLSALDDQRVAGGIMVVLGEVLVLVAVSIVFLRWFAADERRAAANDAASPVKVASSGAR